MRAAYRVTIPPSIEPVTVAEAKAHLRLDHIAGDSALDTEIASIVRSAREALERDTRRALLTQTVQLALSEWPCEPLKIPLPPLVSVTNITYRDRDGGTETVDPALYLAETLIEPGEIVLKPHREWPGTELDAGLPVVVTYQAGWTAAANVPGALRAALLLRIEQLYRYRGAVTFGNSQAAAETKPLALGYDSLIAPWRVHEF
jgi:uncharacterized phiE125 gp8 family phage protein